MKKKEKSKGIDMEVIAAYPGLGKTTLRSCNKSRILDFDIRETYCTKWMKPEDKIRFFDCASDIIELLMRANSCHYLLVSCDKERLDRLRLRNIRPTVIMPKPDNAEFLGSTVPASSIVLGLSGIMGICLHLTAILC